MLLWAVSSLLVSCILGSGVREASVTFDETTQLYQIHNSVAANAVAYGNFKDEISLTGWSYLEVTSNETFPDPTQVYAAGLVEGYLTASLIRSHFSNLAVDYCKGEEEYCERLSSFITENLGFISNNVDKRDYNVYWHQVALTIEHLKGVVDGYRNVSGQPSTTLEDTEDLLFLNLFGDLMDLEKVLNRTKPRRKLGGGSCSALVKVLPKNEDIFFSHNTWTSYGQMLRILKKYSLRVHTYYAKGAPTVPGHTYSFSSYPGVIFSIDDFYLLSSGMAVMETTIDNLNPDLYKYISPEGQILTWQRTTIANRLAKNGNQWVNIFSIMNSGTYNNQWMVLDYKKFQPGAPLQDGLFTILEQMPGYTHQADLTGVLRNQSFWPSYNRAYFKDIFNMSGFPAYEKKYGDYFSYDKHPRALIFKRDQSNVNDVESMMKLMRYNDYKHDPLSRCNCTPPENAFYAIAARGDLNPPDGVYPLDDIAHTSEAAIDAKITTSDLFKTLEFVAVSGPTFDQVPPFQWSKSDLAKTVRHEGQPDLWTFKPIIHRWA